MCKWLTLCSIIICLLFTGCGKETPVEQEAPLVEEPTQTTLHTPISEYTWNSITFSNLFPASSYEESNGTLNIFPCYDKDSYISIEKILISGNDFWDNVITQYSSTNNVKNLENYSYVTNESGETIGYLAIDDTYAYIVRSSTLPSGYVDYVLSAINRS